MREGARGQGDTGTRGEKTRGPEAQLIRAWQRSKGAAEGNRIEGWGIYYRMSGDGHGHREFRRRQFGNQELALGSGRLKSEWLTPERQASVAVTRPH
jgi:hypothetical protein